MKRSAWCRHIVLLLSDIPRIQVAQTYTKALETINPRKATANLHRLYINFAKFYEEGGTAGQAEPDLASARKILEKGTKVNFKAVEDLAEIWCEWAELEVRHQYVFYCLILLLIEIEVVVIEITMKLFESCNVQQLSQKTSKLIIMTMYMPSILYMCIDLCFHTIDTLFPSSLIQVSQAVVLLCRP